MTSAEELVALAYRLKELLDSDCTPNALQWARADDLVDDMLELLGEEVTYPTDN